jgi:hypothetical protein
MSLRLYATGAVALLIGGVVAAAEYDDAAHFRYVPATVVGVALKNCDIKNEKSLLFYRREARLKGAECDRAEMLAGYDDDLGGGEITYNYVVKVRYVDPADKTTRDTELTHFPARFVVPVGGQVLIRAHKTKAGKVNSGRWTENLSLAPGDV